MAGHLGVRLPATPPPPRALDNEELFVIEGSTKRNVPTAENSSKYKGFMEIMHKIPSEKAPPKHLRTSQREHADLPAHVGNTARGASEPAKPGKDMPLPQLTTSAATYRQTSGTQRDVHEDQQNQENASQCHNQRQARPLPLWQCTQEKRREWLLL